MLAVKIMLVLISGLILMMMMKVTITGHLNQRNGQISGKVTFSVLFRLVRYSVKIPSLQLDDESPSFVYEEYGEGTGPEIEKKEKASLSDLILNARHFKQFLDEVSGFYNIVTAFLQKVTISDLVWYTDIGVGDAAKTARISGLLWTLKGCLSGILSHIMILKKPPEYSVNPLFDQFLVATSFQCMVSFRFGYAIHAGIKILRQRRSIQRRKDPLLHYNQGRNMNV